MLCVIYKNRRDELINKKIPYQILLFQEPEKKKLLKLLFLLKYGIIQ